MGKPMQLRCHEKLESLGDGSLWEVTTGIRRRDAIIYILRRLEPPGARDAVADTDIGRYYRKQRTW